VPWLDKTVPVGSRPDFATTLPTAVTHARRCRLADLALVPGAGGAGGTLYGALRVHNVSGSPCSLRGRPTIALVTDSGIVFASTSARLGPGDPPVRTVVLAPNSWAISAPWHIGASCGGEGRTTRIRVSVPGDPAVRTLPLVVGSDKSPRGCIAEGVTVVGKPHPGQLGNPPFAAIPDQFGTFLYWLTVSLHVPVHVHAGEVLVYDVVVSNVTDNATIVGMGGTPLFTQRLGDLPAAAAYALRVTDTDAVEVPAHAAVAFQMRLHVPADLSGTQQLTWEFVEPSRAPLVATVDVVP
jgi:hypothetical protein